MTQENKNKSNTNLTPGGKNVTHNVNRNIFDTAGKFLVEIMFYISTMRMPVMFAFILLILPFSATLM